MTMGKTEKTPAVNAAFSMISLNLFTVREKRYMSSE
jgi:hypothetical protein